MKRQRHLRLTPRFGGSTSSRCLAQIGAGINIQNAEIQNAVATQLLGGQFKLGAVHPDRQR